MEYLNPGDIMKYQKGSDHHQFSRMEKCTKEDPWGKTRKIMIPVQEETTDMRE